MSHDEFSAILNRIGTLTPDQRHRLRQELDSDSGLPAQTGSESRLTPNQAADQVLQRRLLAAGVVSEIRPPIEADRSRSDVPILGEPLSATVLRERR